MAMTPVRLARRAAVMAAVVGALCAAALADRPGLTVLAVGDLILGSAVKRQIAGQGPDYPFARIAGRLRAADLTVGNLEGPLTNATVPTAGKSAEAIRARRHYIFRAPPECAEGLADAGFDVVSLANNHAMDYRDAGLRETLRALDGEGIAAVGAGMDLAAARAPVVLGRRGRRVAFLGYSAVIAPLSAAGPGRAGVSPVRLAGGAPFEAQAVREIARARRQADWVIVIIHWGIERRSAPTPAQRRAASAMIDAGACAVIGHHPHVLQGVERRGDGVIAYSLGNFVHVAGRAGMDSAMLTLRLSPKRAVGCEVVPVVIRGGQPRAAGGREGQRILGHLDGLCGALGTGLAIGEGRGEVLGESR